MKFTLAKATLKWNRPNRGWNRILIAGLSGVYIKASRNSCILILFNFFFVFFFKTELRKHLSGIISSINFLFLEI